ncbi:MAG: SAM-dependent chlorinase/fluorinase [Gemmatimonadota bacterium]|nr:MAG: SAM-dependent chlorinase/fluorinase [Gemmatimonadota bacterium]
MLDGELQHKMPIVTFLSDFGTSDGFAAAMKGVVLDLCPGVQIVDATHEIAPGDIEAAAWTLSQYWRLYPAGTVHLAVVDPGVGGARQPMALVADQRYVVAPNNGLVTHVVRAAASWCCVEVAEAAYMRPEPSSTFHGRDIFAPAAAHLAGGLPLERLGPPLEEPCLLEMEPPERREREIRGRVVHVDRFGNLITDIPGGWVDEMWRFEVAGHDLGSRRRTYSDVGAGELLVVIGSAGTVEIAARDSSAAKVLGAARGDPVVAKRRLGEAG